MYRFLRIHHMEICVEDLFQFMDIWWTYAKIKMGRFAYENKKFISSQVRSPYVLTREKPLTYNKKENLYINMFH